MRIAVIETPAGGGPGRQDAGTALSHLLPRLARRGHAIDLFRDRRHGGEAIAGTRLIRLPSLPGLRDGSLAMLSSLLSSLGGYDVVNFHGVGPACPFPKVARLGPFRTVATIRDTDGGPVDPSHPAAAHPAARLADVVTVSSRRLERHIRDTHRREPIYIPDGIAAPPFTPDEAAPLRALGLDPFRYLLMVAAAAPDPGVLVAVRAIAALDRPLPLVIAETAPGDPGQRRVLAEAAGGATLLFTGPLAPGQLDALAAHAHLYLLPAQVETPPGRLLAAMAAGGAVVASDLPDHLDAVGADAFTFTAGDAGDLRRVLAWLLADPEVVEGMRRRAAAAVTVRYCWDRVADAYEQVYQALA
ncbi:glycosyltransferase family 4 protein [Magnetospirillum sp. UT-4]|uniref:glycosyltransferase family 4 protein n=1 Tax=Magnetospirillum sp. UT-4 TaxID=2681467 RepID=UPI0013858ECD|nr:glycosyltransferase family 4 protein [Magnetospirillum sp. UT-4]CAA7612720.1 conserved hypothetical protein [Magnetospirillum sp. UT-4]